MIAAGEFEVTLQVQDFHAKVEDGNTLARMAIDKRYSGDLKAEGCGEMLSARSSYKGSAAYVALEHVSGSLQGRHGSFVLQHFGTLQRGEERLKLSVVPDSGTGELTGLSGFMLIVIEKGQHFYEFDYQFDTEL